MSMSNGGFIFEKLVNFSPKFVTHSESTWKYFFSSFAQNLPVVLFLKMLVKYTKNTKGQACDFCCLNFPESFVVCVALAH